MITVEMMYRLRVRGLLPRADSRFENDELGKLTIKVIQMKIAMAELDQRLVEMYDAKRIPQAD